MSYPVLSYCVAAWSLKYNEKMELIYNTKDNVLYILHNIACRKIIIRAMIEANYVKELMLFPVDMKSSHLFLSANVPDNLPVENMAFHRAPNNPARATIKHHNQGQKNTP